MMAVRNRRGMSLGDWWIHIPVSWGPGWMCELGGDVLGHPGGLSLGLMELLGAVSIFWRCYSKWPCCCHCLVTQSCLTLWPHELQHFGLPCPSLSPRFFTSSLKFMSIELVMLSNHLVLCLPLLLPWAFPSIREVFSSTSRQVTKVLELQLQHLSFQWVFPVGFL